MSALPGMRVRIKALGFEDKLGIVDHVVQKAESFRGRNYSVLVLEDRTRADNSGEYFCFSRDELEFVVDPKEIDSTAEIVGMNAIANEQSKYTTYQLDASTYIVYDQIDEKEICVCSEYEDGVLPEIRAKMIIDALNFEQCGKTARSLLSKTKS